MRIHARLRPLFMLAVVALVDGSAYGAPERPPLPWAHTRALSPSAAALLLDASACCPAVRALVAGLERTDVVVYVSDSTSGAASVPPALLQFITAAGGIRYLLVQIDPRRTTPAERIVWLAHELQHAREVASAPEVRDAAGMARLYRHIGWEWDKGRFESRGAQAMGERARNELAGHGRVKPR